MFISESVLVPWLATGVAGKGTHFWVCNRSKNLIDRRLGEACRRGFPGNAV